MAHTKPGETREKVYRFMRERLLAGKSPTMREVQEAMGFAAVESARKQLQVLVAQGRLRKAERVARGYSLPEPNTRVVPVPIVGRVQAGSLQAAIEAPEGYVAVECRSPSQWFALRVRGDSMIDAGIGDGDIVVVQRQARAENGQIVVAMVEDEATVKRLRLQRGKVVLEPANDAYEPITVAADQVRILGRVVEVRRKL